MGGTHILPVDDYSFSWSFPPDSSCSFNPASDFASCVFSYGGMYSMNVVVDAPTYLAGFSSPANRTLDMFDTGPTSILTTTTTTSSTSFHMGTTPSSPQVGSSITALDAFFGIVFATLFAVAIGMLIRHEHASHSGDVSEWNPEDIPPSDG